MALELALEKVPELWLRPQRHSLIVDSSRMYPYFCNNAFLMRTDRYTQVVRHRDCCKYTDEATMNQVVNEQSLPMCFLERSFGIHPAWSSFGMDNKFQMETLAMNRL